MFSSDFQCLARVAYESSDDSQDENDDETFENQGIRYDSTSPTPVRTFDLPSRDVSKVPRVSDISSVNVDMHPLNTSQVIQSKNKESHRMSLDHSSKPMTINSSIKSSITRFSDRSNSNNKKKQLDGGLLDDGKDVLSNTSSRSGQLSAATLSSSLLPSLPTGKQNVQMKTSTLQHAFNGIKFHGSASKKRKISTFTTLFEKNSVVRPTTADVLLTPMMNENMTVREIQFGPSFIQKKVKSTDDLLDDEPSMKYGDEEGNLMDRTKSPTNFDHNSPFADRGSHSARSTKQLTGQLMAMLNSIRRQKEESWMRITSGSYPPTRSDMHDPRSRATSYVDLTIISDPKKNAIPSTGDKYVSYLCYIHSMVCKRTQQDVMRIFPTSYRRRSKKIMNHESCNLYPLNLMSFPSEDFVSKSRCICFSVDVLKGMVPCRSSCLRVYDPIIVPLILNDRCETKTESSCSSSTNSILLCTRFYEPCPDTHPIATNIL